MYGGTNKTIASKSLHKYIIFIDADSFFFLSSKIKNTLPNDRVLFFFIYSSINF